MQEEKEQDLTETELQRFGKVIQKIRLMRKLTQKDLGGKIGYSRVFILRLEKGRIQPRIKVILELCKVLDTSLFLLPNDLKVEL